MVAESKKFVEPLLISPYTEHLKGYYLVGRPLMGSTMEEFQLLPLQIAPSARKFLRLVFGSPEDALLVGLVCVVLGLSLLLGVSFSKSVTKWNLTLGFLMYLFVFSAGAGVVWLANIRHLLTVGLVLASAVLVVATLVTLSIINQMMMVPVSE